MSNVFLKVHTGTMYSGKTSGLSSDVYKFTLAGRNVKVFKPLIDDRSSEDEIKTHSGLVIKGISLEDIGDIYENIDYSEDLIAIDEVQFFSKTETLEVVEDLLRSGISIVVAGLDMDCYGVPFGAVPDLMAIADEVIKYKAVCKQCAKPAIFEFRIENDEKISETGDNLIDVGGIDKYIPLCRSCFYKRSKK